MSLYRYKFEDCLEDLPVRLGKRSWNAIPHPTKVSPIHVVRIDRLWWEFWQLPRSGWWSSECGKGSSSVFQAGVASIDVTPTTQPSIIAGGFLEAQSNSSGQTLRAQLCSA